MAEWRYSPHIVEDDVGTLVGEVVAGAFINIQYLSIRIQYFSITL